MCRAVIREMHIEIHKHQLKKNGEDDIYETVPAICLAIVQNYTLTATQPPKRSWSLRKRKTRLDDDDEPPDPASMEHLLTLKNVCELFTDEFQHELSGLMYRATMERDSDAIVDSFCSTEAVLTKPPKEPNRKRKEPKPETAASLGKKAKKEENKRKAKEAKQAIAMGVGGAQPDMSELLKKYAAQQRLDLHPPPISISPPLLAPPSHLPTLPHLPTHLGRYDTDGSISNLLEMERETPEAMLEPAELQRIQVRLFIESRPYNYNYPACLQPYIPATLQPYSPAIPSLYESSNAS